MEQPKQARAGTMETDLAQKSDALLARQRHGFSRIVLSRRRGPKEIKQLIVKLPRHRVEIVLGKHNFHNTCHLCLSGLALITLGHERVPGIPERRLALSPSWTGVSRDQVLFEPRTGEVDDGLQRAGLLEQVCCVRYDFQSAFAAHQAFCLPV